MRNTRGGAFEAADRAASLKSERDSTESDFTAEDA
jgi:hypothetical protein